MVRFKLFALFKVDHFPHPGVSSLTHSLSANLLHSLIMQLIVWSQSLHSLNMLFCVLSILADIVLTKLVSAVIRSDLVYLFWFLFLRHVQVFLFKFRLFIAWNIPIFVFSFHFCFVVIFLQWMLVLFLLFLVAVIYLPPRFLMLSSIRWIDTSMWLWSPRFILFIYLYIFVHTVFLCHFWDVRNYASRRVFLLSGPFVEVLCSSTLRMVRSILQKRQSRYLFL